MSNPLDGRRIAFRTANEGVEQAELVDPWTAVTAAGGQPVLLAPEAGEVQCFDHLDRADVVTAEVAVADARVDDYDGVVLPGGVANPDQLRTDTAAVAFLGAVVAAGKPVAVICHGPWSLIEAGVVEGRTLTSWPSVRTDIENAGGTWVDREVVTCTDGPNTIVSSRNPGDLPAFTDTLVRVFAGPSDRVSG